MSADAASFNNSYRHLSPEIEAFGRQLSGRTNGIVQQYLKHQWLRIVCYH
jgi:hypothetical protein